MVFWHNVCIINHSLAHKHVNLSCVPLLDLCYRYAGFHSSEITKLMNYSYNHRNKMDTMICRPITSLDKKAVHSDMYYSRKKRSRSLYYWQTDMPWVEAEAALIPRIVPTARVLPVAVPNRQVLDTHIGYIQVCCISVPKNQSLNRQLIVPISVKSKKQTI